MPDRGDDIYPDRETWPAYWQAIRTAAMWLLVAVVIVGGGAFLPQPEGFVARFAMDILIGLCVIVVATFLANRVNAWWQERHA